MPQLGETVTEGTITKWLKQVGDQVAEDDVLFEVSTDKVDSEVPSPVSGFMSEILVAEGETVDVGTKLAVIASEAPAGNGTAAPAGNETPPQEVAEEAVTDEAEPEPAPAPPAPAPAKAPEGATDNGTSSTSSGAPSGQRPPLGSPAGSGGTRPTSDRPPSGPGSGGSGTSKVLSPVVRRLIAEHDLDASQIEGTGAGGRITRDDVLALIDRRTTPAPPPAPAPAPAAVTETRPNPVATPAATAPPPSTAGVEMVTPGEDDTVVPFTNIRRRTAEHMVRSKQTSAHTVVAMEVDYVGVERVRTAEKERFKQHEGVSLTYLPFIARAVIDAIADWPHMNSSVGDDALIVHNHINLGIAVDLNFEGLLVPVIHDAGDKRLRALAREVANLADRARSKRLTMDDISGGTFTLTNAGPFGTLFTIPVINQPQIAIIATDGVRKKPVVVEMPDGSDAIAIHPVGNLILSFDHRAVDGAYASAFMRAVKVSLETRDWSSEL